MKIKKSLIIFFVILFALFFPSIVFFVSNLSFVEWNFITAWKINKYLEKFFENDSLNFKNGDYYYRFWEYEKALKEYNKIRCTKQDFCPKLFHNVWNTLYYLWDKKSDLEKIDFWQRSVDSYLKSLSIKEDKETLHNYEYVKSKLDELLKKMQEEKEKKEQEQNKQNDSKKEDSKENNDSWKNDSKDSQNKPDKNNSWKDWENQEKSQETWSWSNNWQQKEGQEKQSNWNNSSNQSQQSQNTSSWNVIPKWESRWLWWTQDDVWEPLSKEEQERIDDYIKWLKEQEKENMKLNVPQRDFWDIFGDMDNSYDW